MQPVDGPPSYDMCVSPRRAGLTLSPSLTAVREASDEERSDGEAPADTVLPAAAESRPATGYTLPPDTRTVSVCRRTHV